jgi:hypothetical protein
MDKFTYYTPQFSPSLQSRRESEYWGTGISTNNRIEPPSRSLACHTLPHTEMSSPSLPSPSARFSAELEFVQCLASPEYLNFLAQARLLEDPAFMNFLQYLTYWKQPQYARFIT